MRLFFAFILGMILSTGCAIAQDDEVMTASSALQGVLSNLQQSIEKLSLDNAQWQAQDKGVKQRIAQLQMQLGRLETQGNDLDRAAVHLHENDLRQAQEITRLEKENSDLDAHIQKTQGDIKLVQRSLDTKYHEYQKLISPARQAAVDRQKEKLKLMKMVYDSQLRQETLHRSILELKKSTNSLPVAQALVRPPLWDEGQMHQLEFDLKDLEKNYAQLKDLTEKMSQKAKSFRPTVDQKIEEKKLQGNMNDLTRQSVGLRADLDDLRAQMVELDKRKSYLEMMLQH